MNKMKLIMESWRKKVLLKEENEESPSEIIKKAIDNTDADYLERSLTQRNPGGNSAGSTFVEAQTIDSLKNADWKPLTHNPEAIKSPAIAFEANISGKLGAADINDVPDDLDAVIQPAHGGKGIHRATGKLMAELAATLPDGAPTVDFTTIILGPKQGEETLQVWTFHPGPPISSGDPIFLEDVKKKFNSEEDKINTTIGEAKKLGFEFVKHVPQSPNKEG